MIYSLDTNTCIRYLNGRSKSLQRIIPTIPAEDIVVCSVVRGKLFYGAIRADLEKQGTPIGLNDLLIAAIALANDLALITHNVREFGRIANLRIEDRESE